MTTPSIRNFHAYGVYSVRTLSILISVVAMAPVRAETAGADYTVAAQANTPATVTFDLDMLKGRGMIQAWQPTLPMRRAFAKAGKQ